MGACASTQSTSTASGNGAVNNAHPRQQMQAKPPLQQQHVTNQAQNSPGLQPSAPPLEERSSPEGQNSPKSHQPETQQSNTQPTNTQPTEKMAATQSRKDIMTMLKRYVELEKIIRPLEAKNVVGTLSIKKEALAGLEQSVKDAESNYKKACDKVVKEKADVDKLQEPSVKAFFADQTSFDAKMSKEQEEYLEAVNEQEVVKSQLESFKSQKSANQKEIDSLSKEVKELNGFYGEQDDLLGKIFSGEYGSELENKLEVEVDQLRDRRDRIAVAKYKWSNSKVLLQHACNQMALAVRRWQEIPRVQVNDVQGKYQMATECRNNIVAASQNISSAQKHLSNIKFPYCEPAELNTLNKACNNIYVDMQTTSRYQHAFECYNVTHKRAAALLQWFNSVLEQTIEKDFKVVQDNFNKKSSSLRQERMKLIKEKSGGDIKDLGGEPANVGKQNEFVPELTSVMKPDVVPGNDGQTTLSSEDSRSTGAPTPLPLDELAPAPSTDELFGNIEQLKKEHEEQLKEFEKAQEINKARMEQGLQEKLRERRNRRQRMEDN